MDERRRELRASDTDRQAAAEQLRAAHDEGRLDIQEYDARLHRTYQAVTYGDLADLFTDLPAPRALRPATPPPPAPAPTNPEPDNPILSYYAALPRALKVLWTIWLAIVCVNLTVWALVSLSESHLEEFWPMWLAIPGAALFGLSFGAIASRKARSIQPPLG
jgi:hypothetical protein